MEVLGRAVTTPDSSQEWFWILLVIGLLVVTATLAADLPSAMLGVVAAIASYLFDAHVFIPAAMAIGAWIALIWRGKTVHLHPGKRALRESIYLIGGFCAYEFARHLVQGDFQTAVANGHSWLRLEHRLHVAYEQSLQQTILSDHRLLLGINSYYSWAFLSVVGAALYWAFICDDFHYKIFRTAMGISCALAVITMAIFPMAPPRLLPGSGIIGTHAMVGGSHSFVNEFAALPSLHVGWTTLTAVILYWAVRSRWRYFWLFSLPTLMMLAVMASGHHYFLDGVVGSVYTVVPAILLRRRAYAQPMTSAEFLPAPAPSVFGQFADLAGVELSKYRKVRFSFYGLGSLLVYLLAREVFDKGFTHYWGYQVFQIALSIVVLLGLTVYFRAEGGLSWATHGLIVVVTWADSFGTAGHMYDRYAGYDKITHFLGCMFTATLVCDILLAMKRRGSIGWSSRQLLITGALFAILLGAGWEVYEYFGDKLFDTGRWAGEWDTNYDLMSDTVGAICGALLVAWMTSLGREVTNVQPALIPEQSFDPEVS